jgi:hypothetical protein
VVVAVLLALVLLIAIPKPPPRPFAVAPQSLSAKARAIRKSSFESPEALKRMLPLSRDPDPRVRELAVLALGVNLVVADLGRATPETPSVYAASPLRDSLRTRLLETLRDPVEGVRAEAARALWKAPAAFGAHPEAAETLAAVLDRALRPEAPERLAWLALDAAAGAPHPALKRAAARFALATPDTALARAARRAAQP